MEMEVPATNTRRLVRRSTTEPAAKDNPAPASRVPATGATGKKKGLLLSSTWVYCCHLGLITANAGGMLEMEVPATNMYEETCQEKYNGICKIDLPGPNFEKTGYLCNK